MNFLNSPGAVILRELGIGGSQAPWARQQEQGGTPLTPAPGIAPMGGVPQQTQAAPPEQLPYKRPGGFFNKMLQAMMGGM